MAPKSYLSAYMTSLAILWFVGISYKFTKLLLWVFKKINFKFQIKINILVDQ